MRSRFTKTFGSRGQRVSHKELEEANELLCSCNSVDPCLFLVLVRVTLLFLRPPSLASRARIHVYLCKFSRILVSVVTSWPG